MSEYKEEHFTFDLAADAATPAIDIRRFSLISAQCMVDGAPAGTLRLEGRNVPNNDAFWDTSPGAPPQTVSAPGLYTYEYVSAGFSEVRYRFMPTGGSTGKMSVYMIAKER